MIHMHHESLSQLILSLQVFAAEQDGNVLQHPLAAKDMQGFMLALTWQGSFSVL